MHLCRRWKDVPDLDGACGRVHGFRFGIRRFNRLLFEIRLDNGHFRILQDAANLCAYKGGERTQETQTGKRKAHTQIIESGCFGDEDGLELCDVDHLCPAKSSRQRSGC